MSLSICYLLRNVHSRSHWLLWIKYKIANIVDEDKCQIDNYFYLFIKKTNFDKDKRKAKEKIKIKKSIIIFIKVPKVNRKFKLGELFSFTKNLAYIRHQ
jgi:hypothetical protein